MRLRLAAYLLPLFVLASLLIGNGIAMAAPEAHILRIDPRAAQTDGAPILSTVIEVGQHKRLSEVLQDCAGHRGDAQLTCMSEKLAQPGALFAPLDFYEKNAFLMVTVEGADQPAKYIDKHKWGESQGVQGVGTAWLILLDAASSMGPRWGDAKAVALGFVNAMAPQDIADVMVFGDRQVVTDTKWLPATRKADLITAVERAQLLGREGRDRPLSTIIRNAATDAFKDLGNAGSNAVVPLHQTMVLLSNGSAGADAQTNGAGASVLNQYLTAGRFPPENTAIPKAPLPTVAIYFPTPGLTEEFTKNAQDFMTSLANPEIGGYFNVVRGNGPAAGPAIAAAVRNRFNQMFLVRWRVSCVAPTVTQSFKLVFNGISPPIAGDNSFRDVPVGIDPTTWPIDIDVPLTTQAAKRNPVFPGGTFTVYGSFCWGSNKDRAEVYFVPEGQAPPQAVNMYDIEGAKRAQKWLVANKMDGKALKATDTSVEFQAPDAPRLVWGKGDAAVSRLVVYDTVARRMSGVTASTILSLKASESAPWPILWIVLGLFGAVVVVLLLVIISRSGGGNKRRRGANPSAPGPFGSSPMGGGAMGMAGVAPYQAPQGGAPPGYAVGAGQQPGTELGSPGQLQGGAPMQQAGAPGGVNPDFLYGGKPPQYGLTSGQPQIPPMAPANPYGPTAFGGGGVSRATLSGGGGVFIVLAGVEMRVGRDGAQCQIALNEPRVSAVHGTVKLEAGQLYVRDEHSNNGTLVNGNRVEPGIWIPVPNGSMLRFGPTEFAVRLE